MITLCFKQTVHVDMATAWEFISNPCNLNHITPDDLAFEIVSEAPEEMFNGLLIEYRVKIPYIGKQKWLTEIKHIRKFHSFVDEQRIGPYKFWYHYHELKEVDQGVRIIDRVTLALPYGFLGKLLYHLFIRKMLTRIFAYRKIKFADLPNRARV